MDRRKGAQHKRSEGRAWFAPKTIGYGAGLPIAWEGWALLIGYLVIVLALTWLAERSLLVFLSLFTTLTFAFALIVRKTTRGGWRWRSGKETD